MTSLFSRKKPEDYSNLTSSLVNTGLKTVNPSLFASPVISATNYFSNRATTPKTTSTTSVVPKTIQGSGYGTNYASNPTNYTKPTITPTVNKYTPTQNTTMDAQTKAINDYLAAIRNQTTDRVNQVQTNLGNEKTNIASQYDLLGQSIKNMIPTLQTNFNTFKTNTEADIADVIKQGEQQKQQTQDYYGEANRTAAQAREETSNQARQKFAAQGAVDSAGAGSYREATENIDSDFNRTVAQNATALAGKLTDIDTAVGQYQRQAKALISQEEASLNEQIKNIEIQYASNEVAKQQAIDAAVKEAQQRVYTIQDTLAGIEQTAMAQKQTLAVELAKLDTSKLSAEFMATGVPTNQAEYEYLVQNADKFKELGLIGDNSKTSSAEKALGIAKQIQNVTNEAKAGITGRVKLAWSDEARKVEGLVKQLSAELQLEDAKRLKGQGTITNAERQILADSIAALNLALDNNGNVSGRSNLSVNDFNFVIDNLVNELEQESGGATSNINSGKVIMVSPDGQQYQVDQSEVQQAMQNGWRTI